MQNVYVRGCSVLVDRPAPAGLFLAACNSSDATQQWQGKAFASPPSGAMVNLGWNQEKEGCVVANPAQHTLRVDSCDAVSEAAAPVTNASTFHYNRTTRQIRMMQEMPRDRRSDGATVTGNCIDTSGGIGPEVMMYSCHSSDDVDVSHQQYLYKSLLLESISAPHMCVAVRSSPGRQHTSILLPTRPPHISTHSKTSATNTTTTSGNISNSSSGHRRSPWSYTRVDELIDGVDLPHPGNRWVHPQDGGLIVDVIYTNGKRKPKTSVVRMASDGPGVTIAPPSDLTSQHLHWNEATFPSLIAPPSTPTTTAPSPQNSPPPTSPTTPPTPTTANAVLDCGAKGDGATDDQPALQACLNTHHDVFLPKGHYRLSSTLKLNGGNRLVGLSQTHSVLMPMSAGFHSHLHPSPVHAQAQTHAHAHTRARHLTADPTPLPLVSTVAGAPATIAFVGIVTWWHLPSIFTLRWRSRGGLYRSNYDTRVNECLWLNNYHNYTGPRPPPSSCSGTPPRNLSVAKAQVSGTGAFINYVNDEDILMTDHIHYRHLHIFNNSMREEQHAASDDRNGGKWGSSHPPLLSESRLLFYEINLEHGMSQANLEISGASHVNIYGLKCEGSNVIMWMRDSDDVRLYGFGPAADAFPNASYYPTGK